VEQHNAQHRPCCLQYKLVPSPESFFFTFLLHQKLSLFGWLVADGWCWFVLREEHCWLVAAGCWWLIRSERKVLLTGG
jgi:hypothetical protein